MPPSPFNKGYVFAALTVTIWCGFILVSRLGGITTLTSFDVVALRFTPAAFILLPVWLWQRRPAQLFTRPFLVLAMLGGAAYSLFVYAGFKLTPAAHAAILLPGLLPFEIALFAWWLLDERPVRSRWIGLVFIAIGVAVLAVDSFRSAADYWRGDLLVIAASICWSMYTVLARRWNVGAWEATVAGVLLTALFYLPIYWFFLPNHLAIAPIRAVITQALYQGVLAVVIAMALYMKSVAMLGASRMGALMALVPAGAALLAVPLLSEPMTAALISGLLFVSLGAYLSSRRHLPFSNR